MKPFMIHVFTYYTFICTHINFGPAQRLEQQIILDKNIVNGVFVSSLICVCLSSLFLLVDRPWLSLWWTNRQPAPGAVTPDQESCPFSPPTGSSLLLQPGPFPMLVGLGGRLFNGWRTLRKYSQRFPKMLCRQTSSFPSCSHINLKHKNKLSLA